MKIGFITIAVLATLVSACDTEAPENTAASSDTPSLDAYLATLPRNDAYFVDRNCLAAVAVHSGLDRTDLNAANYKALPNGAQTSIFKNAPGITYVGTLPSWECFADNEGEVTRIVDGARNF